MISDAKLYEQCREGGEKLAGDFNRKQLAGELLDFLEKAATKKAAR
jgi:hypothetical protein